MVQHIKQNIQSYAVCTTMHPAENTAGKANKACMQTAQPIWDACKQQSQQGMHANSTADMACVQAVKSTWQACSQQSQPGMCASSNVNTADVSSRVNMASAQTACMQTAKPQGMTANSKTWQPVHATSSPSCGDSGSLDKVPSGCCKPSTLFGSACCWSACR